ncbi:MAG: protein-glutamate O-methyltransferase CheR [Thaumarchaeota archaeon]|nr:protein-glutamate O-methyltransferase CheR [Nitrososphaerota archaeon]
MSAVILESQLKEIKKIVKKNIDVNIDHFETNFLSRRIERRMRIMGLKSSSKYVSFLDEDPLESLELNASLSINVTEFFRNREVWDVFQQKIIPKIIKLSNNYEKIRIWSAGCATGNEPYSLAMGLSNALKTKEKQFVIIATDMNPTSIEIAKTGKYESEVLKNIPNSLMSKFLEKIDDDLYKFNDGLKKFIHFQVGDVDSFNINQVDVIVCRNLLIYYSNDAKDLLFKKFHKTLKDGGFLVLGMAERIPSLMEKFFESVELRQKIYQKVSAESIIA